MKCSRNQLHVIFKTTRITLAPHLWYEKEKGAKLSPHMGKSDEYLEILHKLATAWAAENFAEYEGFGLKERPTFFNLYFDE
jgi:hypothetical protein